MKTPKPAPSVTHRKLSWWVRHSNLKLQILLFLVILVTVFARVVPLEMQKRIVNEAIFLGDIELLMLYCGIYLAAVVLASGPWRKCTRRSTTTSSPCPEQLLPKKLAGDGGTHQKQPTTGNFPNLSRNRMANLLKELKWKAAIPMPLAIPDSFLLANFP